FERRIIEHQFGSLRLKAVIADHIAELWYDKDCLEIPWLLFLKQHALKSGGRVFDLGAHQAIVALQLADAVSPGGHVIAVEANPHNADIAAQNVKLNQGAVTVLHCAIAAENGSIIFNNSLNGQVATGVRTHGRSEVPARTVDSLTAEFGQPDLIFMDIEGFECEALKGARQTLEKPCNAFIAVHGGCGLERFGGSNESILKFFPTERYALFYSPDDEHTPFEPLGTRDLREGSLWFLIALDKNSGHTRLEQPSALPLHSTGT
ncbi:MAG: FkbM family methyltransferase, partial [Acetobacteraceae bacterium]|nr:FkbM family methyltransferase [Acetobacteraceae bacterium]